ncbi:MAG TPA: GxGYxYP domain-containing protein, partial [Actinopolymorphaceae bacterium]
MVTAIGVPTATAKPAAAQDAGSSARGDGISWPKEQALPRFAPPGRLDVVDIAELHGDLKLLLGTLQGVVNREKPRIYLIGPDATNGEGRLTWLKSLKVPYKLHEDPWAVVSKYRKAVRGVVVYDPDVPDTINVATTLAGLKNAVVAAPAMAEELRRTYGFEVLDDLRGRFGDRLEAYEWQFEHLWPKTTHRMLIGLPPMRSVGLPPGIPEIYDTLAKVTEHEHDAANRDVYEFDVSDKLGGEAVWMRFDDAFTNDGWGPAVGQVTVRADGEVIAEFVPGTEAEEPYLFDAQNSQISAGPPQHRFADNDRYFVYRFAPPAGTQQLTVSVRMWNEYTVSVTDTEPQRPYDETYAYLRDYAVANKAMVFWLDPNVPEQRDLFERIMEETDPPTPYLGWFSSDVAGEFSGTELVSKHGVYVLAADWFENM